MTGIASAATAVVIGYVAGGTRTIRVGAGGIMLPNHSPLVIAGAVRHARDRSTRGESISASGARRERINGRCSRCGARR